MIAVLIVFHAANVEKKESDENNTRMRQRLDIDETVLLLAN